MDERYNGWTNRETWTVALWLSNDQEIYRYVQELTRQCCAWWECCNQPDEADPDQVAGPSNQERAADQVANELRRYMMEGMPAMPNSQYSDLLTGALSRVNYREIAESCVMDFYLEHPPGFA